jgi:hypothetical protein
VENIRFEPGVYVATALTNTKPCAYAQTMRVRGPIQTQTGDSFEEWLSMFSASYRLVWYGMENAVHQDVVRWSRHRLDAAQCAGQSSRVKNVYQ